MPRLPLATAGLDDLTAALPAVGTTVAAVFLAVLAGAVLRRRGVLDATADATLLKLLVRVFIPALIVSRVLGNRALADWRNVLLPPVIAFVLVAGGFAAAALALRLAGRVSGDLRAVRDDPARRRTFALCTGMFNYGYVTIPLVGSLFDRETLGVLFVFNVGVEAAMWGVGVTMLAGGMASGWWRRLFGPPVVATLAALVADALERQFGLVALAGEPGRVTLTVLGQTVGWLADAAIPVGLLLTGATIADDWARCRLREGKATVATASVVRLAALPIVFVALAATLPLPVELRRVLVLQAAMPAAVFPIVLSRHYGGDVATALRVVVGTSLVSLVTMPLWVALGLWLVG